MNHPTGETTQHFLDYWRVVRVRLPLIALIFLLTVISAGVITYLSPKKYESSVTMQVLQPDFRFRLFGSEGGAGRDPRFATTQFEIIQRKEILYPVVETLNLVQRWGEEYGIRSVGQAYGKLRSMISVREIRNTDLLAISVRGTNSEEAAEIANAVADAYQKRRIEEVHKWLNRSLSSVEDEVVKQRQVVQELRKAAADIATENGIIDLNPDTVEHATQAVEKLLITTEDTVHNERMRISTLNARFEQLTQLSNDQIMRGAAALNITDPTIQQILPIYNSTESEEARLLNAGLGANHPSIRGLRAQKETYQRQLFDAITALRRTLESELTIAKAGLAELENQLTGVQDEQKDSRARASEYIKAKNDYIQAKSILEATEMRLSTERMQLTMPQSPATIWEKAEPNNAPVSPKVVLNMALGIMTGLVLGIGFAFFIEYLDTSVKTMDDIEGFLKVPVISVIRKGISILINEPDTSPDAEAYRIMRTNIEFSRKSQEANTITVVSGGPGEGKSTTVANVAYTFAKGDYTTLIIDADLRRPSQHRIFGVPNKVGLSDYLTSEVELDEVLIQTKLPNLYILPSGKLPTDAVGILNSQRMMKLINEAKSRFDVVFFDSPPILGVSDASVISSAVDLTMIVVQHRRFPKSMLTRVKQAIDNVGGTILGVILNNVDVRHDQYYEYYTSYYNYYAKPAKGQAREESDVKTPPRRQGNRKSAQQQNGHENSEY